MVCTNHATAEGGGLKTRAWVFHDVKNNPLRSLGRQLKPTFWRFRDENLFFDIRHGAVEMLRAAE